jgi:hypothetical protein
VKVIVTCCLNTAFRQPDNGFIFPDRSLKAVVYFLDGDGENAGSISPTLRGAIYDSEVKRWRRPRASQIELAADILLKLSADQ